MDGKEPNRLDHVLNKALQVFLQYGYRKTSVEDIAKAAGISRQGLYLHFKNKDEILGAAVRRSADDGLQTADAVLGDTNLGLEEKLLKCLNLWFGRHAGRLGVETSDLAPHCERILGDFVKRGDLSFQKRIERTVLDLGKSVNSLDKQATAIAEILCACGLHWKHVLPSTQEFQEKMRETIDFCCRDR